MVYASDEAEQVGAVRVSKSFFNLGDPKDINVFEIQPHAGIVTRVAVSFDDTNVFSTGEDGCLIIYSLQLDKDNKMKYDKDSMGMAAADEFLMQRQKYNDQISENMKLFHQIESKKHKQE